METVYKNPVLCKVFGLFQDYQNTGQFSRLLLETRGGALTAHLSVQCSPYSPCIERTRPTEARKPRRNPPSRRKRNQARREKWLADKKEKNSKDNITEISTQDNSILGKGDSDSEVVHKSVVASSSTDSTTKVGRSIQETIVEMVKVSETNIQNVGVIEQIDGQIESTALTCTFDLTISAVQLQAA